MFKLFQGHLPGVHVPYHKDTANISIAKMPIPDQVTIPMSQQIGAVCEPLVKAGDSVYVGQMIGDSAANLSAPIHASVSGTVARIEEFITVQNAAVAAVVIDADKLQTPDPSLKPPQIHSFTDFILAVRESGLVGLGGAGFPAHAKLNIQKLKAVDTLLVNAAECEPYITCDTRAILEESGDMFLAIREISKWLDIKNVIIGIEDNKPEAIRYLKENAPPEIKIHKLRSLYPQGGEKVLIYETTGQIVREGQLPLDSGIVVMNVSSLCFLGIYLRTGMPLTGKWLTVAGSAIAEPKNVYAPLGTLYRDIIAFCGGYGKEPGEIFMGGPMMGINVYDDDFPLLKNNNAIVAFAKEDVRPIQEGPCIHCGKCVAVCPLKLMPNAIDQAFQANDLKMLKHLKVNLCMECGCCAYICPAKRQLVLSNKLAKQKLKDAEARYQS